MLLALLILVAGLLGGADGGPILALDAVRSIGGAAEPGIVGEPELGGGKDTVRGFGGGISPPAPGGGGVPDEGGMADAERGIARGGGGVAAVGAWFSAPAALFIQRF